MLSAYDMYMYLVRFVGIYSSIIVSLQVPFKYRQHYWLRFARSRELEAFSPFVFRVLLLFVD